MSEQNRSSVLLAVADGEVVSLSTVEDEVFCSGMLGIGFAIEPSAGTIFSPADGVIAHIAETGHAYTMNTRDGLEILIHIGIDTVALRGKGFLPMVNVGDEVRASDVIARVDLERVRNEGYALTIPVIVSNAERMESIFLHQNVQVTGGESAVWEYQIKA